LSWGYAGLEGGGKWPGWVENLGADASYAEHKYICDKLKQERENRIKDLK
jgi:hypothetical protein